MRPASSEAARLPAPAEGEGSVAPPTATGVAGGVARLPDGLADALAERPGVEVALAVGRGVAGRGVATGGFGVGLGVAGTVTEIVPPAAVAPVEATKVTVHVPAEGTRADRVHVEPLAGRLRAINTGEAPLRVNRAVIEVGLGLPTESTLKTNVVLVLPVRGLTDPLRNVFLARTGLATATTAIAAISNATPEPYAARCLRTRAIPEGAAKGKVPLVVLGESWRTVTRVTIALMGSGVTQLAREIEDAMRAAGTPERADQEKRYLKSDLEFLGASVWEIRQAVKSALQGQSLDHDGLVALVRELWRDPMHERRMAAVAALELRAGELGVGDMPLIEELLRESRTWALVDGLAADVAGSIAQRNAGGVGPILDRWAADPDFWVRRAALLAELKPLRSGTAFDRFARHADAMLDEREFFIRKAIGWVLRETGKRRATEVIAWLAPRTGRASGVTMREAIRSCRHRTQSG